MLTVTRFDAGDVFHTSVSFAGTGLFPCVCISRKRGNVTWLGIPPSTYGRNLVGDHACLHNNLKGALFTLSSNEIPRSQMDLTGGFYDTASLTVKKYIKTDVYTMKGKQWTHFLYPGQSVPYTRWYTGYSYVAYVGTLKRTYSHAVRWKSDKKTMCVEYFMEQWKSGSPDVFMRNSWQMFWVQYNGSYTSFRTMTKILQNEACDRYDRTYFPSDSDSGWSSWTTLTSASKYTLTQSNVTPEFGLSAGDIWQRGSLFSDAYTHPPNKLVWEKLSMSAIESTKTLDINTPMYLADFFKMKETFLSYGPFFEALSKKRLPSWEEFRKASLAFQYGLKLTFLDTQKILKNFSRQVPTLMNGTLYMCHSRDSDYELISGRGLGVYSTTMVRSYNLKIYYSPVPDDILENIRQMFVWDVFPSLENVWDIIPFSFVVDWFIRVGDFLATYDYETYLCTLKIKSVIMTQASEWSVPASAIIAPTGQGYVGGWVSFKKYDRRLTASLPIPVSRLGLSNPLNRWAEGGLLFIRGK